MFKGVYRLTLPSRRHREQLPGTVPPAERCPHGRTPAKTQRQRWQIDPAPRGEHWSRCCWDSRRSFGGSHCSRTAAILPPRPPNAPAGWETRRSSSRNVSIVGALAFSQQDNRKWRWLPCFIAVAVTWPSASSNLITTLYIHCCRTTTTKPQTHVMGCVGCNHHEPSPRLHCGNDCTWWACAETQKFSPVIDWANGYVHTWILDLPPPTL